MAKGIHTMAWPNKMQLEHPSSISALLRPQAIVVSQAAELNRAHPAAPCKLIGKVANPDFGSPGLPPPGSSRIKIKG
jgi:hypothetical protein